MAAERAPSVVFLDECDSVLSQRSSSEHEASRRLKTEVLVQLDGATSANAQARVVLICATNRPQELDEALIRRLPRRIYVPLPCVVGRRALLTRLLNTDAKAFALKPAELEKLVALTDAYSGSDLAALCREAALQPLRELDASQLARVDPSRVRPLQLKDFTLALRAIRPSVAPSAVTEAKRWGEQFGAAAL